MPDNLRFTRYKLSKSLQLHKLPVDCARKLFKPSEVLASLLVRNEKKFKFWVFVGNIISGIGLGLFGQGNQALGPNRRIEVFITSFY